MALTAEPRVRGRAPRHRAPRHSAPRQLSERRQFAHNNAWATGSTVVAGLLGLGLQAMSGHELHPAGYGKAFAVYSFYQLVTRPSAAFGRLQAWRTSRDLAGEDRTMATGASLLRQQTVWLLSIGGLIALASAFFAGALGSYLHVPARDIVVSGLSAPFLLAVQPLLGFLQGEQKFVPWSVLSVVVNLSRVVAIGALIVPFGAFGFLLGNTIAAAATFVACLIPVWVHMVGRTGKFRWGSATPFIVTGLVSTVAMGVYQGADVVMVEHFFNKTQGGQYAAVASIGSAVFFATGGVASAVFPMIAAHQAKGKSTLRLMGATFALYAISGVIGTVALALFGRWVMIGFAGHGYIAGAHYLALYALGMALLSWVVVLINTLQSLNSLGLLWVLVPAAIARPLLLLAFHHSLNQVVDISDAAIGALAVSLTALYVKAEIDRHRQRRMVQL